MPGAGHPPDAIILAGGRAARLGGVDKPGLVVGERSLIASVLSAVCAAGARRVVVVGPDRPGLRLAAELRVVREDPPGGGPVPALRCGLAEVAAGWVFLLAADLPFLRADDLGSLRAAAEAGRTGAVLADETGHPQWLAGCWPVPALRNAVGRYRGSSLRGLLGPLDPVLLGPSPAQPGAPYAPYARSARFARSAPPPWLDCDTPEDVRLARAWSNLPAGDRETAAGSDEKEVRR